MSEETKETKEIKELTLKNVCVINVSCVQERATGFYRSIYFETEDGVRLEVVVQSEEPDFVRVFF